MEVYERIKFLRKQHLKLSQEQFGAQLGVSRSVIANIETNVLARPEQKEPLYRLICSTFNISYEWLTTGNGEMFIMSKQSFVDKLAATYSLSDTGRKIIECYLRLGEEQRAEIDKFVLSIAEAVTDTPKQTDEVPADNSVDIASDIKKTIEEVEEALSPENTKPK